MATLEVRGQTTNFEIYYEGQRVPIGIGSLDLPEIVYKSNTLTGAGIAGDVDMPTQGMTESMELTINWRSIHGDLTQLAAQRAHDLSCRSAQHIYDAGTGNMRAQAIRIDVRGIPKNMTLGKFEQASETESKSVLEIIYLKLSVDNDVKVEIDKFNYIHTVNGTDWLADTRVALGL